MAINVTPVKSYMQAEYLVENPDGGPERPYRKQKRNILAVDPSVPVAQRDDAHAAAAAVASLSAHQLEAIYASDDAIVTAQED